CCKSKDVNKETSKDLVTLRSGEHIVASVIFLIQCPHDRAFPLEKSGKYCYFVKRMQRTTSQHAYKSWLVCSIQRASLYVALKMRNFPMLPSDKDRDLDDFVKAQAEAKAKLLPIKEKDLICCDSNAIENDDEDDRDKDLVEKEEEETYLVDFGGGWGRFIFPPVRKRQASGNECLSINQT
ncbi:hypothetical protein Ddye_021787, partial [Dipteronia dyeriana]